MMVFHKRPCKTFLRFDRREDEMLVFDEKAKTEQTIPRSAIRLTAPFAQGSHMVWRLPITPLCTREP